ncbi:MAG: flagellar type III secretion system protein FliR [Rhodospirillales bacterium]|nr:MAG: flagellar type III secretion system protein FliR [Rhodospirillales bacterium]
MPDAALSGHAFAFLLIFVRIGAAISVMPGLSATFVSMRVRLLLALAIAFVLVPGLADALPPLPATVAGLALIIIAEAVVGLFIGLIPRMLFAALHIAGTVTALSIALANALVQDPVADQQSSTVAGFFATFGLVLVFVADLHHLLLEAVVNSYALFPPGDPLLVGDFADALTRALSEAMLLGLQLSAPFVVVAFVYNVGLGLLGRLMPQLPVFFFGLPVQISMQLWAMMLALSGILMVFLSRFGDAIAPLAGR